MQAAEKRPSDSSRIRKARFLDALDRGDVAMTRWLLSVFLRQGDPTAVRAFLDWPELWSIGPFRVAAYMAQMLQSGHVSDASDILESVSPDAPDYVARLRAVSAKACGRDVGAVAHRLALGRHLGPPVRSEAMMMLARTPMWNADEAVDVARDDESVLVRRAAVASFSTTTSLSSLHRKALKEIATARDASAATAAWVLDRA